jgi:DNA invertase Pin-like site-specific DNA recombinase
MIAIGYARISKKGDEKSVSIELQKQQIADYCKRQGFDLSAFVTHDGVSGTKRKRFASLDEAVKKFSPSHVVVYHLDRLARDSAGLGDYLRSLTKRGIALHETAGLGKIDNKQAVGRLVTGIRGVTDQYFAELTGEKTAAALKLKRDQGLQYTNIPPLGWRYLDGRMLEDPEEQRALLILRECSKVGLGARRALSVLKARQYTGRQSLKCVWSALERINND